MTTKQTPECRKRGLTPEDFIGPDGGETKVQRDERERRMIAVCRQCPLIAECLEWAIEHREKGVWGGTTEEGRKVIRRRRARRGADGLTDAERARWAREAEAWDLYCAGVPVVEIAEKIEMSTDTAYSYIRRQREVHRAEADAEAEVPAQAVRYEDRHENAFGEATPLLIVGELL